MPIRLKDAWLLLAGMCLCLELAASPATTSLQLLSRAGPDHPVLTPSASQQRWLQARNELVLGTSAPDYPPFDMTSNGRHYEGLTADYAAIVAASVGLEVRVERFESRQAAVQALRDGKIDLLGSANSFEADTSDIRLSMPYAVDQPVLVTRENEPRSLSEGLDGLRLSMVYHYLPLAEVRSNYPGAILQTYPSYQNALNAVAFEEADVFLGDTISTHYLINQGHLQNVKMANFGRHEPIGFSFALHQDNQALLEMVNATLQAIAQTTRERIFRRWSAGSDILLTDHKLQLSRREEQWLSEHPVVRVVVNEQYAPLTFFDKDGHLRGITADLLELIRLRTGLRFEIVKSESVADMLMQLRQGKAELIAAAPTSAEHDTQLAIGRPYLENSYVLLTRQNHVEGPAKLEHMTGQRLAIGRGNPLIDDLRQHFPGITLVQTDNAYSAAQLLAQGQVEGAVSALVIANHLIDGQPFEEKLTINSTLGTDQASFSLATAAHNTTLASVLDKALLSIAPEELGIINSRWRGYRVANDGWRGHERLIYQVVLGCTALLMLSLAWNAWMRRQIKLREESKRALNDQFEFMRALVNGTPHPIYVRDRAGLLQMCNDSYLQAFSTTREAVIGKAVLNTLPIDSIRARQVHADYQHVMDNGQPMILDRQMHINGRSMTIYHWILPYRDSLGELQGIIGGWIDISERRQLIEALHKAKDQADAANRAKSTFLATMSHEIRTPMNALIGMLELAIQRADYGHLDRPAIEVAYNCSKDLLELIGDILDIARIESGHMVLSPERVHLGELVGSVVRVFDGLARQKQLSLALELDPRANRDVLIDPLRFKQILSNLVSNAIKFTDQGGVTLKLNLLPEPEPERDQLRLNIQVSDTGVGISRPDQQRLFEPFAQVDTAQNGRGGAGLGLVICRNLCQLMKGVLSLDSEPGRGTCVNISMTVPCLEPCDLPAPIAPALPTPDQALNVLVVDDHPANRLLLSEQLNFLGLRHSAAVNGAQGLENWLRGDFDVLIVDCNMPVMNGYDLTRALREHEQAHALKPCTVLGYTANAQPGERERCLEAGMNDCLIKPLSLVTLRQRLAQVSRKPGRCLDHAPVFSATSLDNLTGKDPLMQRRLLESLLQSNLEDRALLSALVCRKDVPGLKDLAHKLKGAARLVEAHTLEQACEQLESLCTQHEDWVHINPQCRVLAQAMVSLESALDQYLREAPPMAAATASPV